MSTPTSEPRDESSGDPGQTTQPPHAGPSFRPAGQPSPSVQASPEGAGWAHHQAPPQAQVWLQGQASPQAQAWSPGQASQHGQAGPDWQGDSDWQADPGRQGAPAWQANPVQRVAARPQLAVVTWSIIALCIAVWLAERALPGFFDAVAFAPALTTQEPWRLIISAFAHADNPTHILFNMLALWQVGRMLEIALGRAHFVALYLLSALGGGVGFYLLSMPPSAANPLGTNWYTAVVGASGAVFGLFGAMVPIYRRIGASLQGIVVTLLLNAAISFTIPGIAWQSHLGGFLVGLAVGGVLVNPRLAGRGSGRDRRWWGIAAIGLALVVLLVAKAATV